MYTKISMSKFLSGLKRGLEQTRINEVINTMNYYNLQYKYNKIGLITLLCENY